MIHCWSGFPPRWYQSVIGPSARAIVDRAAVAVRVATSALNFDLESFNKRISILLHSFIVSLKFGPRHSGRIPRTNQARPGAVEAIGTVIITGNLALDKKRRDAHFKGSIAIR
jgi:hypothetical protein